MIPASPLSSFNKVHVPLAFSTANRKPLPPPSREAMARAAQIFAEVDEIPPSQPASQAVAPPKVGFTTGSLRAIAPPSKEAIATARNLFNDIDSEPSSSQPKSASQRSKSPSAFSVSSIPTPSASAKARAFVVLDQNQPSTPGPSRRPIMTPQTTLFRTPTATRTPLASKTNTLLRGTDKRTVDIKATPVIRRLGLGGTPASAKRKREFVTPFKDPSKAKQAKLSHGTPLRTPIRSSVPYQEVFDLKSESWQYTQVPLLTSEPPDRKSYREAYLKPQYYSPSELGEFDM